MTDDISSQERFAQRLEPVAEELVLFARRMLDRADDAEDVLQAALAAAWKHRRRFVGGSNFRAWIYRFLVHEIQNANRRTARLPRRAEPSALAGPEEDFWTRLEAEMAYRELFEHPEELLERLDEELAGALKRLLPAERLVLLLRAIGELKCEEIAEVLRVPKGTVMARLFRARVKIRERLGESFKLSSPRRKKTEP